MTMLEAVYARHSVRTYLPRPIEAATVQQIEEKIAELNAQGDLHLQFLPDTGGAFRHLMGRVMGLATAPSAIACVGPEGPDLEERVGYYGEELVLYAQQLGLNTCWVGMYNKGMQAAIAPGERLVLAIAIGYGATQGKPRRSKTAAQVAHGEDRPAWFDRAVELALLAPTAINQQKFEIAYDHGAVRFTDKGGPFSQIDLGIIRRHFDLARPEPR